MSGEGIGQARVILAEEAYTETLTSIVTRDYYPAISSLRRDDAILNRRAAGDVAGAVAIRRAARKLEEHELQQCQLEKEADGDAIGGIRNVPRPLDRETVNGFVQRATCEDDEEFEVNQRKETKERRERMDIIYSAALGAKPMTFAAIENGEANDSNAEVRVGDDTPLLASDKFNAPRRYGNVSTVPASQKNSLFSTPHLTSSTEAMGSAKGEEQKQLTNDDPKRLMPPPPPVPVEKKKHNETSSIVKASPYERLDCFGAKHTLIEYTPRETSDHVIKIQPSQTRFPYQNQSRQLVRKQAGDDSEVAIRGTDDGSETGTDLDATPLPLAAERAARAEARTKECNSLVAMTPVIIPGKSGGTSNDLMDGDESPIVTWGSIAATPLVLNRDNDGDDVLNQGTTFSIPNVGHRERAAKRAEEKLSGQAKLYKSAGSVQNTTGESSRHTPTRRPSSAKRPRPETTTSSSSSFLDRTASLTPAARALLDRSIDRSASRNRLGLSSSSSSSVSARSSSAFGSALRESYTPKLSTNSSLRRRKRRSATDAALESATPLQIKRKSDGNSTPSRLKRTLMKNPGKSITDGLLNFK